MLLRFSHISPSLTRNSLLFSILSKTPSFPLLYNSHSHRHILRYCSSSLPLNVNVQFINRASRLAGPDSKVCRLCNRTRSAHLSTTAAYLIEEPSPLMSKNARKKARRESPVFLLQRELGRCSKYGDLARALQLYDNARNDNIHINVHSYNVLLHLCSSDIEGLDRGFEIFREMSVKKVDPNEATFTSAARLAAAKEDSEMAFELVKKMKNFGILPKLRSYGPALFGFCNKGMAEKAYEVYSHMSESGVLPEENELRALLKVSSESRIGKKVYEFMQKMRASVRQVSEETAEVIENWFRSKSAEEIGEENWDFEKVKEGVLKGGGGWHGQGWLRTGKWRVVRTEMEKNGVCRSCGEKLVLIDIDPKERENFANSLSNLACQREVRADFMRFQEWLEKHGPFDAIIDGANVGLANNNGQGHKSFFNFHEVNSVVNMMRELSPTKKLPLIIMHKNRATCGPAKKRNNVRIIEDWKKSGILYTTPNGSNDDWYWLYAAVSCKCLLVTKDEMRDHLFQLLGTSFFPRWKEKYQVRYTFTSNRIDLHMPPPYSIVIQESEQGSWHVPTVTGDDVEKPRQWLCATRTTLSRDRK